MPSAITHHRANTSEDIAVMEVIGQDFRGIPTLFTGSGYDSQMALRDVNPWPKSLSIAFSLFIKSMIKLKG